MIGLFAQKIGETRPFLAAGILESVTPRPTQSGDLGMRRALMGRFPGSGPVFVVVPKLRVTGP